MIIDVEGGGSYQSRYSYSASRIIGIPSTHRFALYHLAYRKTQKGYKMALHKCNSLCRTILNIVCERLLCSLKFVAPTCRCASPAEIIAITWPGDRTISSFNFST